jgi:hypothetical protein
MATKADIAALLADAKSPTRPDDAVDCAVPQCDGYVTPAYIVFTTPAGVALGLCPKQAQHRALAAADPVARQVIRALMDKWRASQPVPVR